MAEESVFEIRISGWGLPPAPKPVPIFSMRPLPNRCRDCGRYLEPWEREYDGRYPTDQYGIPIETCGCMMYYS